MITASSKRATIATLSLLTGLAAAHPANATCILKTDSLPPCDGAYVANLEAQFLGGLITLTDVSHHAFTACVSPPKELNVKTPEVFNSIVDTTVRVTIPKEGTITQKISAPTAVGVDVTLVEEAGNVRRFNTEMTSLLSSTVTLPSPIIIPTDDPDNPITISTVKFRESLTKASTGKTVITKVPEGYQIGSFFDVFVELSIDGGNEWIPADESSRVRLTCPDGGSTVSLLALSVGLFAVGGVWQRRL